MGPSGISIWQLLIILVIVLLLFGTKRLRSIGADLGNAVKGFRDSLRDNNEESTEASTDTEEAQGLEHNKEPFSNPNTESASQKSQNDTNFR